MSDKSIANIQGRLPKNDQVIDIEIAEVRITHIELTDASSNSFPDDLYIASGLVDNQVNGYVGIDFSDPGLTVAKVREVTQALWKTGVTTYLPTLITGDPAVLKSNFEVLAKARKEDDLRSSIPGFHLEGPYISSEDGYRGAHSRRWAHAPDWDEFLQFNRAAEGNILQITLAPELDGALEFIRRAQQENIVVALGHHDASSEQIAEAAKAGASISTHLGNGCANMIHRHKNPLWPQLANDRLSASIIVDGHHLTSDEVKTFYKVKGPEKLVLISDMTKLAGLPAGEHDWNGKEVTMTDKGKIKYPKQNVLAGSSLTLREGLENMVHFTSCSLHDAITMASRNPARLNGLDDRGTIAEGKRADFILFTYREGRIQIQETIVGGQVVYDINR